MEASSRLAYPNVFTLSLSLSLSLSRAFLYLTLALYPAVWTFSNQTSALLFRHPTKILTFAFFNQLSARPSATLTHFFPISFFFFPALSALEIAINLNNPYLSSYWKFTLFSNTSRIHFSSCGSNVQNNLLSYDSSIYALTLPHLCVLTSFLNRINNRNVKFYV
jgi:hypothetical protein